MKLQRFIGNFDLNKKFITITEKELINQIRNVLRLKVGDTIILCDGRLKEGYAQILKIEKNTILCEIVKSNVSTQESVIVTKLYCSLLKRENFELVVQKTTEIGIREIIPCITQRTIKFGYKKNRLQKIIKEAAEQSGRAILPILHDILDFNGVITEAKKNDINIFFDPTAQAFQEQDINLSRIKNIGIFIGPEGGWDDTELTKILELAQKGCKIIFANLGKTTLRSETAAIVATYVVVSNIARS